MSKSQAIFVEQKGAIAHLVLNRPDKRNALSMQMWAAIPSLLAPLRDHTRLRALVVRGAGGVFSAGADITEFETVYASREAAIANHIVIQAAMASVETFPAPTIAAIEGACVGGGCGLALACDLRIADANARFGITPGKLGLAYGVSDTRRLVQAVGLSQAKRILFTGALFAAPHAKDIGLVDELCDADAIEKTVDGIVGALQTASSHTARTTKRILRMLADGAQDDTPDSRALFGDAFDGADFKEGYRAFLEKRPPQFE